MYWLQRFFEECLGCTHGVEFQCVAPQSTMAALIGGATLHSWGDVPINQTAAVELGARLRSKEQMDGLFLQAKSLRWLLTDEISGVAPAILKILDTNLRRACSTSHPYARRRDKSRRSFGGVNIFTFGDWWQLGPVRAVAIFSNPFLKY